MKLVIVTKKGFVIKFDTSELRTARRRGKGVACVKLTPNDEVVACQVFMEE